MSAIDDEYGKIALLVDWECPADQIPPLRPLAAIKYPAAMNLLAVLLGDIDSVANRSEIIELYEGAHKLGNTEAAGNLAIQYEQWGEPKSAEIWRLWQNARSE